MGIRDASSNDRIVRHGPYPELTWPGILVGWVLGSLITVSIGYASLILGFSIEGSELAAILGWGILRGMLRRTSIVENNINQTLASAVNGASAGMMFSIPALFILSDRLRMPSLIEFDRSLMVLACITGGIIGLAFVIPLRKQMIDFDRLAYPGGIAVATILKSPGAGIRKAMLLLSGGALSAAAHFATIHFLGDHAEWEAGKQWGWPSYLNITFFLSMMTVGVGFLSGKGGFWFGAGGFVCYWVLAPLVAFAGQPDASLSDAIRLNAKEVPDLLRVGLFRPVGIGMLIGAALGGIVAAFPLIRSAFHALHEARSQGGKRAGQDELPVTLLYGAIGVGTLAMIGIVMASVDDLSWPRATLMVLLGTLWIWVAGVIVSECLGRTNWSPLSGMTLIGVTIVILVARKAVPDPSAIVASVILGAAICVAIAQAGDMMLDLKSGYLIGAVPRRQQIAQLLGAWLGPIIVMFLVFALHEKYTLGSEKLPAPQGAALAGMIEGILGANVPAYRYVAGAGLGAMLASSGLGGIGVLIGLGFYMPFSTVLTYTIGCIARVGIDRWKGPRFSEEVGIPFASGLIVGEALIGVGSALVQIF
ncbi:MAG: oligopeptide transporter OPT family protein [Planctomycetes bacterium]|nr:oligopeptide transporter OPT family protein [Planctomycetota bacterium]